MARSFLVGAVIVLLATTPYLAAADVQNVQKAEQLGKGMAYMPTMSTGKGGNDVDVDVQCNDVCNDVCTPIPNKVCNEVPYQTQVCNKVPVPKTKQVCNRICTKTTVMTETIPTPAVSTGKGKGGEGMVMVSAGKGHRRLAGVDAVEKAAVLPHLMGLGMLAGKAIKMAGAGHMMAAAPVAVAHMSGGKGGVAYNAPQTDTQCNDVCNDVQITEYQTQCQMVTNTKTKCDIVMTQKCDKVCRPNCKKITTVTSTTTTAVATGKGKGAAPVMSFGKGH